MKAEREPNDLKHDERKIDVWTKVFEGGKVGARVEREGGTVVLQLRTPDGKMAGMTFPVQVAEAFRDMLGQACAAVGVSVDTLDIAVTTQKTPPPPAPPPFERGF